MSATLDIALRAPMGGLLVAWTLSGLLASAAVALLFRRRAARARALAREIESVALGGEPQRARIRAREAGPALEPLLKTLSGETRPPLDGPIRPLVLACAAAALPSAGALGVALVSEVPSLIVAASAGAAVLAPTGLLAGRAAARAHQATTRTVRGACVELLEANTRADVDRQRSVALTRRDAPEESPRGVG
jgi:hypothetical protein